MSGAVEMAESFLVTSWLSFLAAPVPTVTVLDLRRALVEEPSSALEGCSVDMVTVVAVVVVVTRILSYCSSVVLLLCCCCGAAVVLLRCWDQTGSFVWRLAAVVLWLLWRCGPILLPLP